MGEKRTGRLELNCDELHQRSLHTYESHSTSSTRSSHPSDSHELLQSVSSSLSGSKSAILFSPSFSTEKVEKKSSTLFDKDSFDDSSKASIVHQRSLSESSSLQASTRDPVRSPITKSEPFVAAYIRSKSVAFTDAIPSHSRSTENQMRQTNYGSESLSKENEKPEVSLSKGSRSMLPDLFSGCSDPENHYVGLPSRLLRKRSKVEYFSLPVSPKRRLEEEIPFSASFSDTSEHVDPKNLSTFQDWNASEARIERSIQRTSSSMHSLLSEMREIRSNLRLPTISSGKFCPFYPFSVQIIVISFCSCRSIFFLCL